jgi:hypothetical protein
MVGKFKDSAAGVVGEWKSVSLVDSNVDAR